MKAAILVDSLTNQGGIERLVLEQALDLKADVYAGYYFFEKTFEDFNKIKVFSFSKCRTNKIGTLKLWHKFRQLRIKYDYYLLYGTGSLNAAYNHHPNLWYCNSPSRYLYDLYQEECCKKGILLPAFIATTAVMRWIDQNNVKKVDKIVVNSKNVQERVRHFYKRSSEIIYPPTNLKKFKFNTFGNFFLSTCRIDPIKRVHLVVKAFQKLPRKKLVIASTGPDEERIIKMIAGYDNITFLGRVSEKKLWSLYADCFATIYLSHKEDFGLIPIESMAAGKPCIATNEGGFKETIIHKKTGYLVDNPEDIKNVINAINWMTVDRVKQMKDKCIGRAELFSEKRFHKKMRSIMGIK